MSDPTLPTETSQPEPKRKKTKLTLAIIGCTFGLVVLFLIGPTLLLPLVLDRFSNAQHKKAELDIEALMSAAETYALNNRGTFPEALEVLIVPDENGETYLRGQRQLPLDPWGNDYLYFQPTTDLFPRIVSYGKDGKPGGEGSNADIDSATLHQH